MLSHHAATRSAVAAVAPDRSCPDCFGCGVRVLPSGRRIICECTAYPRTPWRDYGFPEMVWQEEEIESDG